MRATHSIHGGIHPVEAKALSAPGTVLDAGDTRQTGAAVVAAYRPPA